MSTIEKMSIMGIRSFGIEEKDRQIIRFFSPLTLILGPNGTGKTTIIECLKYITTGDTPPNTKGGAFVHDPKVAQETVVRGQVRLQLRDVTGKVIMVQRSMEATQKLKKIETRTLDAVITRFNADNEKVSMPSKCADLEQEMVTALGVPKPVLDNVIFCHQEDACWPLSEGKALKEKFDAIFASTRYTKVLENIRALRKDQELGVKLLSQEVTHLKGLKDKVTQLEGDLAEQEAKSEAAKDGVVKVEQQLEPIRERLVDIEQRYDEVHKVQTKVEKLKITKELKETTMKDLRDKIEKEFQGSTEELEKLLSKFASKVEGYKKKLNECEDRSRQLSAQDEKLGKEWSHLLMEMGKLEQEAETHEKRIKSRNKEIRLLAAEYNFDGFERETLTDDKHQAFLDKIAQKVKSMEEELQKVKSDFETTEKGIQQKMDSAKEKKTKQEQIRQYKQDQMNKNKMGIRQIRDKLSDMEASAGQLDHLNEELKNTERDLSVAETTVNLEELKIEIAQMDKERRSHDSRMSDLNSEMNRLQQQSSAYAQLEMLKKDKTSLEDKIRRTKAKHEDSLTHLMGSVPSANIRGSLDDYLSRQSESTKKCRAQLQKDQTHLSQKETEKNILSKQIKEKEEKARELEDKISNVCGNESFEDGLVTVQQKLSETQDQRGSLMGAEHFFQKYTQELKKPCPTCPLCHREFDTDEEVRELVLELENKLRMVPTKLHTAEEELTQYQQRYDNIVQLRPIKENLSTIQEQDLPTLKTKLQKINEEIKNLKVAIEQKSDELLMKETDEKMAVEMRPDILFMDRCQGDLREKEKKIAVQSSTLSGGDTDRTLQVVINEKEEVQMMLDTVNRKLEHKRQKHSAHMERVQSLKSEVNRLQGKKLTIDAELQQRTKLEQDQAQLISDNIEHQAEIKAAQEQLSPLEKEISSYRREMDEVTGDKEAAIEQDKGAIEQVRKNKSGLEEVLKTIKRYIQSGNQDRLTETQTRKVQISEEQKRLKKEQEEVTSTINDLKEDLATQQVQDRDLRDNLELRKHEEDVKKLEQQMADFAKDMGGLDPKNLQRQRQELQRKQNDLNKELTIATNNVHTMKAQINVINRELKDSLYRDASKKHREKMIDLRTTELAIIDLEKYYKAFDRAIMNYHSQKMSEINMIIRELWRNTYRGKDIDTIEIHSDNEGTDITKARRVYNYRVVMLKGDTVLDMRGRCSAGQKVLASILIRLALAETFCMNCGVIALDEPTTNLDRENIESLALALVRIIEMRKQRNFQLVVITHDEDFVERLGRSNLTDYVWKVNKDENGISRLRQDPIQDLYKR